MRKPLKITIIIAASILMLLILISLLAGPIAKSYVNHKGPQLIGRTAHVDRVRANLFTGHVAIAGLQVMESDPNTLFLGIDTLDVSLRLRGLLVRKLHLRHLTLAGLNANIIQEGSTFNFSDIIDHFRSDDPDTIHEELRPWTMGFYNIRLSHWQVRYADKKVGSKWNLNDLNLLIPGVYFDGREATKAGLDLALADGGTLHTNLDYQMESSDFDIDIILQQFNLQNIKAYLAQSLNISDIDGIASAQLKASGNLNSLLQTTIGGKLNIQEVAVANIQKQPLLNVDEIDIDIDKIILAQNHYSINTVCVNQLRTSYETFTNGNTLSRLIKPSESDSTSSRPDSSNTKSQPMHLYIGSVRVNNAALTYADYTLPDPFEYSINNLTIKSDNLTLKDDNTATLTASLPHNGKLNVQWRGSLDDLRRTQDLNLSLQGIHLSDFSPYTVAYLAHPFTDGVMSFTSRNTIRYSQLQGDNHLDIFRPEVGERRSDIDSAMHVPLKAALYVLKDKNDEVLIDIPVAGKIDDPEFNYMKIVWSTLRKLFVKVAGSPLRGAANALGIKGDDIEFIEFTPTQSGYSYDNERIELSNRQYYQLQQLATIARSDSSMLLILQQQLTATDSSSIHLANQRNNAVRDYLLSQGVPARQLMIVNAEKRQRRCGYAIDSELLEPEE